jgi:hypothetical protein
MEETIRLMEVQEHINNISPYLLSNYTIVPPIPYQQYVVDWWAI